MLQQILRDMWIDPELLAELDDDQKQNLFCKMREEQVRRWKSWDSTTPPPLPSKPRPGNCIFKRKKVGFLMGADGEPWVWIMGEHQDDKTIEQILDEEAREAARKLAEKETQQLRLSVEAELDKLMEQNRKNIEEMEQFSNSDNIYCSADELRQMVVAPTNNSTTREILKRDALQEITSNKPKNVSQKISQWEKRTMEEKTSEIFKRMQKKKQEAVKEAEEAESKHEELWREQQIKAKQAERQIREIARRAREEHRKSVQDIDLPLPQNQNKTNNGQNMNHNNNNNNRDELHSIVSSKPPNKDAVLEWFRKNQIVRRAGLEPNTNDIAPWFHGLITRHEAESLLNNQPVGSFLVRLSERIWGYAISYRDVDRCKHYLVDASNGHYQFLGTNQISHNTLGDLVNYHGAQPITALGGELLGKPCLRNNQVKALFIRAR